MRSIAIIPLKHIPLEEQEIEIVERKGLGHPDTICDSIMNEVSVNLCKEYLNKIGTIMHHNIDKSLLVAGEVEVRFGGGIVKKPMKLIFGDRATFKVDNIEIPVAEIAIQTAKDWFKKNLRFVDPEEHIKYQVEIQPGSQALTDIFRRGGKILEANDTSAAVGWAPLTKTEKMVLSLEKYLNSKDFKRRFPETGEDVKVMGFRRHRDLNLTISMAFVDRFISDEEQYFDRKAEVLEDIKRFVEKRSNGFDNVHMELNTLDAPNRGIDGVYLTVLGTSADGADSGQVGRGNRVNGLISLNRPQCSEAAAGKNPVSHVGKIYNLLTHKIADKIYSEVDGVREVYVWMLSKIGQPIDQPVITAIQLIPSSSSCFASIKRKVREIVEYELENIDKFSMDLAYGKIPIC
ncbi:MAG TPA: methionine adenosyltransferase [Candidatus Bathyarchaeota archaeon]|nr:methionine adenosyltransferase [Candidatus Bathyarchaeota archaeon]